MDIDYVCLIWRIISVAKVIWDLFLFLSQYSAGRGQVSRRSESRLLRRRLVISLCKSNKSDKNTHWNPNSIRRRLTVKANQNSCSFKWVVIIKEEKTLNRVCSEILKCHMKMRKKGDDNLEDDSWLSLWNCPHELGGSWNLRDALSVKGWIWSR